MLTKIFREACGVVAKHHNRFQFAAYEGANAVLALSENIKNGGDTNLPVIGQTPAAMSAYSFIAMSSCLYFFDPEKRPHLLLHAGLAGVFGGGFLAMAGFGAAGFAVALSSLEMARGGYHLLAKHIAEKKAANERVHLADRLAYFGIARITGVSAYTKLVSWLTKSNETARYYLDERPLLTSTAIKAPLRFDIIGQSLMQLDFLKAAVGLSWLAGDLFVALNDGKIKDRFLRFASPPQEPNPSATPRSPTMLKM